MCFVMCTFLLDCILFIYFSGGAHWRVRGDFDHMAILDMI